MYGGLWYEERLDLYCLKEKKKQYVCLLGLISRSFLLRCFYWLNCLCSNLIPALLQATREETGAFTK
jgi:hypothetical protein